MDIIALTKEIYMMENLKKVKCMEGGFISGEMVADMRGSGNLIK